MLKLITLFVLSAGHALAGDTCDFSISVDNFVGEIQTQEQAATHGFTVSTEKNSGNCKNFRAYFGRGNANSYNRKAFSGNKTVNYNIYKESALNTVLKNHGDAGAGEFLAGNLPNRNTNYNFNFFFKLIDLDSVFSNGPGYYNDLIPISFYTVKNNGNLDYQTTRYMNVAIVIPRYAELSLGPANAPHDPSSTNYIMNFGTLEENEAQNAVLNVKGNVGFGVYMSSQNGGKLLNAPAEIPYTINVNNLGFRSLSNPGQSHYITQRNSGTPETGSAFPVQVKIGNVPSNPKSGDYDDVITITIDAW